MNTRIILTGGPGAGKTTALAELARRGHLIRPEAGRDIIREEVRNGGDALPWKDATAYAARMLDVSKQDYQTGDSPFPVFFDRGIPDVVGYLRLIGQETAQAAELRENYPYHPTVFLFPPWEAIYENDTERTQDFAEAVRTCDIISDLYRKWGYSCMKIPEVPVTERVDLLLELLRKQGMDTDTGFTILFFLEGSNVDILEIKRNNPKSTDKKDIYQWLFFDRESGVLRPLSFVSMEAGPEQIRVFGEGVLRFGNQTGSWESDGRSLPLHVPGLPRLSVSLRNQLKAFLLS